MTPTRHAIALIAIVVLTLTSCIGLRARPRLRAGLAAALGSLLLSVLVPGHLCDGGHPWSQLLIGSACTTALVAFVRDPRMAAGLTILVVLSVGRLAWDYMDLVHQDGVTGNPHPGEERRRLRNEERAREILAEMAKSDGKSYPEGWLLDAEFSRNQQPAARLQEISAHLVRIEVHPLWHSWFTGLYSRRRRHGSLWYTGGTLADAAPRIEWRERNFK